MVDEQVEVPQAVAPVATEVQPSAAKLTPEAAQTAVGGTQDAAPVASAEAQHLEVVEEPVDPNVAIKLARLDQSEGAADQIVAGDPTAQGKLADLKTAVREDITAGNDTAAQQRLEEAAADRPNDSAEPEAPAPEVPQQVAEAMEEVKAA